MSALSRHVPVSVVIPAYRARHTLGKAIESVERQTAPPCEVIVVDDASGDGTADEVRSLQAKYPAGWLKLIELPRNGGAGEARNAGWDAALGQCIAFLDADDTWHPRKLELQSRQFVLDPSLALCGHAFRFPWDPEVNLTGPLATAAKPVLRRDILWHNPFVTPSVMVRRELPFRFCPGKRHMEDHLLWMEVVLNGYACAKLDARLATIGKPQFGAGGLSGQLWAMEKGDLDNYWQLNRLGHISVATALLFSVYSLAKYLRRLAIVGLRRIAPSHASGPAAD